MNIGVQSRRVATALACWPAQENLARHLWEIFSLRRVSLRLRDRDQRNIRVI